MTDIAALFVEADGIYASMPGVECWDVERDARTYAGPHRVVAHPPCARWSRLAGLVHSRGGPALGDDDGCFASALASVERFGGVLEHPAESSAFPSHALSRPKFGHWRLSRAGWVTEVNQSAYGHRANKATWLYLVGKPSPLDWRRPRVTHRVSEASGKKRKPVERMSRKERKATPPAFARLLLDLARGRLPVGGYQVELFG